jgi:DMSO/TMAO reductase YedYZ molybdopterin-dependent catalytic subunit
MSARWWFPRPEDFRSPTQSAPAAARIGVWLGVAVAVCFLTGLFSHAAQNPPGWLEWPTRPVGLYRFTQGLHVLSGIAAVPLLLAKLWSVYPRFFVRPPLRSPARLLGHLGERLSILVLVCAVGFELVTGLFNVAQSYPWGFFFPRAHYAAGWLAVGALGLHLALKLPATRAALARPSAETRPTGTGRAVPARRAFLRGTWGAAGLAVLATAGVTVPGLSRISVLAWRTGNGPQGLPVNRTAAAAAVVVPADWRLEVSWPGGLRRFSLAELAELPQYTADLPIACVEGWSARARWTGVPVAILLARAGAPSGRPVRVSSLEPAGLYSASTLPAAHVADPLTLLALRVNGEVLDPDHGFPCRIIAPNRPGVLQTKWVTRLELHQ